jgi:hypothetical protein
MDGWMDWMDGWMECVVIMIRVKQRRVIDGVRFFF